MAIARKIVRHLWQSTFQAAPQPGLNPYWYWLQGIALCLPLNSIIIPVAAAGLMFTFLWRRGWRELDTAINRGWLAVAGWIVITIAFAYDPAVALSGSILFLPFLLLFAVTAAIIRTAAQLKHFLWLLTLSTIPVGVIGVLQAVIDRPDWTLPRLFKSYVITLGLSNDGRVDSIFGYYNEAGIYLAMLLPIVAYFVLGKDRPVSGKPDGNVRKNLNIDGSIATGSEPGKDSDRSNFESIPHSNHQLEQHQPNWYTSKRVWATFALIVSLATLYLTKSRNAWGLAIVGIFTLATYYQYWAIVILLILAALLIGWAVFGPIYGFGGEWLRSVLPAAIVDRLASTVDPNQPDFGSTSERLNAWQLAVKLIADRPISGWGMFNFVLAAPLFNHDLQGLRHEHNFFLSITVALGIPGLLAFLGMWGWVLWQGYQTANDRRIDRATRDAIVMTMIGFALYLLSGLLDVIYNEPRINLLSWLLLAGVYGVSRSQLVNYVDADMNLLALDHSHRDETDDNGQFV
jgi:hypothetical protein